MKNLLFILTTIILFHQLTMAQVETSDDLLLYYQAEERHAQSQLLYEANESTSNYDVTHYRIDFTIDPDIKYIKGRVTPTVTALEDMDEIVFDFADSLQINAITENGDTLDYSQSGYELRIQFPEVKSSGSSISVTIDYEGVPLSTGFGTFEQSYHSGVPVIWTLSEPYGAMEWWPCKQDLKDKADSIDILITAPEEYTAVSNGIIVNETINEGWKTTHWSHSYPIPAYLIGMAVSNYVSYSYQIENDSISFPIINYVYPEDSARFSGQTGVTVPIMELFSSLFEPYPYHTEKYGHCQFGWGGGMEHTTISFMGGFNRNLIAHELAHQWFGDKVTCASWQDIWLNEGFAGYLTGLVHEHLDGQEEFKTWRLIEIAKITSRPDGSVYVPAQDTLNVSRVFDSRLTYSKGSMLLHMLRKKIGEEAFYTGLQNYLSDPELAFNVAYTGDLKAHLEASSGMDLTQFFDDWVYGEGYPSYELGWHQDDEGTVYFNLQQTQSHASVSFFEAPVTVQFIGTEDHEAETTVFNSFNGENFTYDAPFDVSQIIIDPHADLISAGNSVVVTSVVAVDAETLNLYPNPTDGYIYLNGELSQRNMSFQVFDMMGGIVMTGNTENNRIDLHELHSGFYIIRFQSPLGEIHMKLIKR